MLKISKVNIKNTAHYFNEFEPEFIDDEIEGIILEVPYAEKDQAKSLGARWNPKVKKWFIPEGVEKEKFSKWIKED